MGVKSSYCEVDGSEEHSCKGDMDNISEGSEGEMDNTREGS